tara:strand:+ start:2348 stop:3181 length:834 start_codon:yes stop_codon:yes gene_type:complete
MLNKKLNILLEELDAKQTHKSLRSIKLSGKKIILDIKKNCITSKKNYFIIKLNNKKNLSKNINFITSLFGQKINQNYKKDKTLLVTPNTRLINKFKKIQDDKLRYHQTNKGGSIHTDGPQHLNTPKFLLMASISNNNKGGESIIVNGKKIFNYINRKKPKISKTLQENFFFERRGFNFKKNNILKKPIFENNKVFSMRYLKEYILTAYKILNKNMTKEQLSAINFLDKLLYSKKFQTRFKLNEGEIIIINNKVLAHGRTSFTINESKPRKILRVWFN